MIQYRKAVLLLILSLYAAATYAADKDSLVNAKAYQLKKRASLIYETKPDSAISFYDQASELFKLANNKKEAAICIQNIAFVYDEYRKDAHKAQIHVREAITIWKETKDTSSLANTYKYFGTLLKKLNDTRSAKKNIDTAIILYSAINDKQGVASSYYDMANVYDHEKKTDSAVYYLGLAKDIWKKHPDSDTRLFGINNMLLRMHVLDGKLKEAKKPFKQNLKQVDEEKIHVRDKLTFYYYSWIYYNKKEDKKKAATYKTKYDSLKTEMKNKGLVV